MANNVPIALSVGEILWITNKAGMYIRTVMNKNLRRRLVVFKIPEYTTGSIGLFSTSVLQ